MRTKGNLCNKIAEKKKQNLYPINELNKINEASNSSIEYSYTVPASHCSTGIISKSLSLSLSENWNTARIFLMTMSQCNEDNYLLTHILQKKKTNEVHLIINLQILNVNHFVHLPSPPEEASSDSTDEEIKCAF